MARNIKFVFNKENATIWRTTYIKCGHYTEFNVTPPWEIFRQTDLVYNVDVDEICSDCQHHRLGARQAREMESA